MEQERFKGGGTNSSVNIVLVYAFVLHFIAMPVAFKEMFTDMEWLEIVNRLLRDEDLQKSINGDYSGFMPSKDTANISQKQNDMH